MQCVKLQGCALQFYGLYSLYSLQYTTTPIWFTLPYPPPHAIIEGGVWLRCFKQIVGRCGQCGRGERNWQVSEVRHTQRDLTSDCARHAE